MVQHVRQIVRHRDVRQRGVAGVLGDDRVLDRLARVHHSTGGRVRGLLDLQLGELSSVGHRAVDVVTDLHDDVDTRSVVDGGDLVARHVHAVALALPHLGVVAQRGGAPGRHRFLEPHQGAVLVREDRLGLGRGSVGSVRRGRRPDRSTRPGVHRRHHEVVVVGNAVRHNLRRAHLGEHDREGHALAAGGHTVEELDAHLARGVGRQQRRTDGLRSTVIGGTHAGHLVGARTGVLQATRLKEPVRGYLVVGVQRLVRGKDQSLVRVRGFGVGKHERVTARHHLPRVHIGHHNVGEVDAAVVTHFRGDVLLVNDRLATDVGVHLVTENGQIPGRGRRGVDGLHEPRRAGRLLRRHREPVVADVQAHLLPIGRLRTRRVERRHVDPAECLVVRAVGPVVAAVRRGRLGLERREEHRRQPHHEHQPQEERAPAGPPFRGSTTSCSCSQPYSPSP